MDLVGIWSSNTRYSPVSKGQVLAFDTTISLFSMDCFVRLDRHRKTSRID